VQSILDKNVRLTRAQWNHAIFRHKELKGQEEKLKQTLQEPEIVLYSDFDRNIREKRGRDLPTEHTEGRSNNLSAGEKIPADKASPLRGQKKDCYSCGSCVSWADHMICMLYRINCK